VSASTTIRVVTQRNWMVEELRAAMANTGWSVQQHYGMSVPPADGAITWMPGAFAAPVAPAGRTVGGTTQEVVKRYVENQRNA